MTDRNGDRDRLSRRGGGLAKIAALAFSLMLISGGIAWAATGGLLNPSFEQGSGNNPTSWTVKAYGYEEDVRSQVYGPGQTPVPCVDGDPYGVCVVEGDDTFSFHDFDTGLDQEVSVSVPDGSKMIRLFGPFKHLGIEQVPEGLAVEQTFTVDPQNPYLPLTYNVFTYDSDDYDQLGLRVKLTSPGEPTVRQVIQGTSGPSGELKTTGWRNGYFDLTEYVDQTVRIEVEARGTEDEALGTWAYVDAGIAPDPPVVDPPVVDPPVVDPPVVDPPVVDPPVTDPPLFKPRLSRLKVRKGKVSVKVSTASTVKFVFRKCVKKKRGKKKRKVCSAKAKTSAPAVAEGVIGVSLPKKLKSGKYQVVVSATNEAGTSKSSKRNFKLKAKKSKKK